MAGIRSQGGDPSRIRTRGMDVSRLRSRGSDIWYPGQTPDPTGVHQVYQGALISHQYWASPLHGLGLQGGGYQDSPWARSFPAPNSHSIYVAGQDNKEVSLIHWSWNTGLNAYPNWPGVPNTLFDSLRAGGIFTHGGWGSLDTGATQKGYSATASTHIADILSGPGSTGYNRAKANYTTFFDSILNKGIPVLMRPWWEMNGSWYAWSIQAGAFTNTSQHGPAPSMGATFSARSTAYKIMWQTVHSWCQERATALGKDQYHRTGCIGWHWCPNDIRSMPDPSSCYPGDDYVDWTGWNYYLFKGNYESPATGMNSTYQMCKDLAPDKPMAISEWGVLDEITGGTKAQFFGAMDQWLIDHPEVCLIDYFQSTNNSSTYSSVWWDSNETNRAAYAELMSKPYMLDNVATAANFPLNQPPPDPRYKTFV